MVFSHLLGAPQRCWVSEARREQWVTGAWGRDPSERRWVLYWRWVSGPIRRQDPVGVGGCVDALSLPEGIMVGWKTIGFVEENGHVLLPCLLEGGYLQIRAPRHPRSCVDISVSATCSQ